MGETKLFNKYADHIHGYIANMWAVIFSTLLSAANWVECEAWINPWMFVHYFTLGNILSLFHFIVMNYHVNTIGH